jgi:hypothetical protein
LPGFATSDDVDSISSLPDCLRPYEVVEQTPELICTLYRAWRIAFVQFFQRCLQISRSWKVISGYGFPKNCRPTLGDLIAIIRNAPSGSPLEAWQGEPFDELTDINEYSKKFHHETNPAAASEPVDDGELQSFVRRTLRMIGGY